MKEPSSNKRRPLEKLNEDYKWVSEISSFGPDYSTYNISELPFNHRSGYMAWSYFGQEYRQEGYHIPEAGLKKVEVFSRSLNSQDKEQFIQALNMSPAMVLITNAYGIVEFANDTFLRVTQYSRPEILDGHSSSFLTSDLTEAQLCMEFGQAIAEGKEWKGELLSRKKSGEAFIINLHMKPFKDVFGETEKFIFTGTDVTAFRETEYELNKAQEEKTVLLSELHHRVKNNLAIISGLMEIQAGTEQDKKVQTRLNSSVGRIKSLANMHELLFESKSLTRINFGLNLEKIMATLSNRYQDIADITRVIMEIKPVKMNINQAHPCSLILNEVITNIFEHAFQLSSEGCIHLLLNSNGDQVHIRVEDNGSGLPENFSSRPELHGLGFNLIETLSNQLHGTFNYSAKDDGNGSCFDLSFRLEDIKGTANANIIG